MDDAPLFDHPWADENGEYRMLYEIMPLRMAWCLGHLPVDIQNLKVLDLGCGGGLMSAAFARLGAHVVGLERCPEALRWARGQIHPEWTIRYVQGDMRYWVPQETFDIILAMEVLEHLSNPFSVIERLSSWLRPGGTFLGSTLNRTLLSGFLGLFMAEKVLKWVPQGTHAWKDFITPEEISLFCTEVGFQRPIFQGMTRDILKKSWRFSSCLQVNYFFATHKHKALGC